MQSKLEAVRIISRHGVPIVIVGGLAVIHHGYVRNTEDVDLVWLRSPEAESALLKALTELEAKYIGDDIDPATGIERAYPVTAGYIDANHLMMLHTRHGFVDLFDYIPGEPQVETKELFLSGVDFGGLRYASLEWLRRMKRAAGRAKDQLDLDNLAE
jgi:hypothetical protein